MKKIIFSVLLVFLVYEITAQPAKSIQNKSPLIYIEIMDGNPVKAYLYQIKEESLVLISQPVVQIQPQIAEMKEIHYSAIYSVAFKNKKGIQKGALIGALAGAAIGTFVGLSTYSSPGASALDFGPGLNAISGAGIGVLGGTVVGAAVGSGAKKTYKIYGNKESFDKMRTHLLQHTTGNESLASINTISN